MVQEFDVLCIQVKCEIIIDCMVPVHSLCAISNSFYIINVSLGTTTIVYNSHKKHLKDSK